MSDLISRQVAIRKLQDKGEEPRYQHTDEDWKCGLFMAEDIINDLPAAEVTLCHLDSPCEYQNADIAMPSAQPEQPEIIRCKDCKQFRRWIDTDTCFCDITESEISDNDFCSKAERRTDG